MIYRVEFRTGIERETRGIPAQDLKQITAAIRRYAETGSLPNTGPERNL